MKPNMEWKEWFEANYLDGDKIQSGQMMSSEECFDAVIKAISEAEQRGCEKGAAEERERTNKYASEMRDDVVDGRYCKNESGQWKNGYDCAMYDILSIIHDNK